MVDVALSNFFPNSFCCLTPLNQTSTIGLNPGFSNDLPLLGASKCALHLFGLQDNTINPLLNIGLTQSELEPQTFCLQDR